MSISEISVSQQNLSKIYKNAYIKDKENTSSKVAKVAIGLFLIIGGGALVFFSGLGIVAVAAGGVLMLAGLAILCIRAVSAVTSGRKRVVARDKFIDASGFVEPSKTNYKSDLEGMMTNTLRKGDDYTHKGMKKDLIEALHYRRSPKYQREQIQSTPLIPNDRTLNNSSIRNQLAKETVQDSHLVFSDLELGINPFNDKAFNNKGRALLSIHRTKDEDLGEDLGHDYNISTRESFVWVEPDPGNPEDETFDRMQEGLHSAFRFIEQARKEKGGIYIHCRHGINRSPALVVAYVMWKYDVSFEHAENFVFTQHPRTEVPEVWEQKMKKPEFKEFLDKLQVESSDIID